MDTLLSSYQSRRKAYDGVHVEYYWDAVMQQLERDAVFTGAIAQGNNHHAEDNNVKDRVYEAGNTRNA